MQLSVMRAHGRAVRTKELLTGVTEEDEWLVVQHADLCDRNVGVLEASERGLGSANGSETVHSSLTKVHLGARIDSVCL